VVEKAMTFLNIYSKMFCCVQLLGLFFFVLPVVAEEGANPSIMLEEKQWVGDFDQLKKKGAIRVLVPVSNPGFLVDGFRKYGYIPVTINTFQSYLNANEVADTFVRAIVIPASRSTILDRLVAGHGDLAVANLTITEERLKKVDFAAPIATGVQEIIVAAPNSPVLHTLQDLSGKTIFTRSFSSYHEHLLRLNKQFAAEGLAPVHIETVADELEDDNLLAIVGEGLIPYMVLDQRKLELWQDVYNNVVPYPNLAIDTNGEIAWVLRKNSPQLLKIVSDFSLHHQNAPIDLTALRESTKKDVLHFNNLTEENIQRFVQLYPVFVKSGTKYGINPLLLAALAFEQSGFSEEKVGNNGELGIMQLAPFIEREVDVEPTEEDAQALELHITAAAKYLASLRENNFMDLADDPKNQMIFVLAAYLNGPEKINEMRWITGKMGKNGNKWFNEVNVTVSRLVGRESVRAVRAIALYLVTYRMAIESGRIVLPENVEHR
jgi:membrane-bound lytic murein transglycosylase MltF